MSVFTESFDKDCRPPQGTTAASLVWPQKITKETCAQDDGDDVWDGSNIAWQWLAQERSRSCSSGRVSSTSIHDAQLGRHVAERAGPSAMWPCWPVARQDAAIPRSKTGV